MTLIENLEPIGKVSLIIQVFLIRDSTAGCSASLESKVRVAEATKILVLPENSFKDNKWNN